MTAPSLLTLSEIWVYPIKSLGGIKLQKTRLTERGLEWDRRWMLLDAEGQFMTQRQTAAMALLEVSLHKNQLEVRHRTKKITPLQIPFQPQSPAELVKAPIWDDTSKAIVVSPEANGWFSEVLGQPCRLVYMPEEGKRSTSGKTSGRLQKVSFADEYPALIIGQASLDDLNSRLAEPLPMNRFRPNLVFTGGMPFEEDGWHALTIGSNRFWAEKPCARCVVTTIDQSTAIKGKEPLATLATYRKWNNKLLFGQNLMYEAGGIIKVGDTIETLTKKEAPLPLSIEK